MLDIALLGFFGDLRKEICDAASKIMPLSVIDQPACGSPPADKEVLPIAPPNFNPSLQFATRAKPNHQAQESIKISAAPSDSIMAAGGEPNGGSDTPREKGFATAETIKTGCIAWVEKDGQPRRAEILSIKTTKSGKHFYCNFDSFNKRLDEWVPARRIDFDKEVEWPKPEVEKPKEPKTKKATEKKAQIAKKAQKRPSNKREQSTTASEAATPHPWTGESSLYSTKPGIH